MEEPTTPDSPTPAQPADEIPDWVEKHLVDEEAAGAAQPPAGTLAEKHKARRQTIHSLLSQSDEASAGEAPAGEASADEALAGEAPAYADLQAPDAPVSDAAAAQPEVSLLDAARLKMRGFGEKTSAFTKRVGQQARLISQRITRRERPARAEESLPEGPPAPWGQKVWPRLRPFLWRGRLAPAFWTVASSLSLLVNIILIVILILLGRQLFFLKKAVVSDQLVNGLYNNFVLMDQAHIKTTITVSDTIQVKDTIPVVFDLPLNQKTVVVLTKDTPVKTTIFLNNTAVPLDLILTEGTQLNIKLDMSVPVNQTVPVVLNVPVNLQVPVDIPLNQTELHRPFVGLQQVVSPFRQLLSEVPDTWSEVCKGPLKPVCSLFRFK